MSPLPAAASRGGASRADNKNWGGVGSESQRRKQQEGGERVEEGRRAALLPHLQVGRRERAVGLRVALPPSAAAASAALERAGQRRRLRRVRMSTSGGRLNARGERSRPEEEGRRSF
ncbi:hypothetical protein MRX96_015694 [Rhipicephalus microplus]